MAEADPTIGDEGIGYQKAIQWCASLMEKAVDSLTEKKVVSWAVLKPGSLLFIPSGYILITVPVNNDIVLGLRQPFIYPNPQEQKAMLALFEADGKLPGPVKMLKFALAAFGNDGGATAGGHEASTPRRRHCNRR
eukprot:8863646-Alexandrium_andersonii.AAC.1